MTLSSFGDNRYLHRTTNFLAFKKVEVQRYSLRVDSTLISPRSKLGTYTSSSATHQKPNSQEKYKYTERRRPEKPERTEESKATKMSARATSLPKLLSLLPSDGRGALVRPLSTPGVIYRITRTKLKFTPRSSGGQAGGEGLGSGLGTGELSVSGRAWGFKFNNGNYLALFIIPSPIHYYATAITAPSMNLDDDKGGSRLEILSNSLFILGCLC